ncbi:2-hydroxycarboxylate transporter family protein [Streptomyces sp. NPDC000348]|uniref:2-hydroxycarboxylate transporter family protein n=1 Tax=Streptomyces sp. NPDC000348 TaxID=3364538 RepID=UPI0036A2DFBF
MRGGRTGIRSPAALLLTCVPTVYAGDGTGVVARCAGPSGLHPAETAPAAATRNGTADAGGTAVLAAAGRTRLVPFARIATRTGGGTTVTRHSWPPTPPVTAPLLPS